MADHRDFLQLHSRHGDANVASVADNCRFEERASTERWAAFDDMIARAAGPTGLTDWGEWCVAGKLYRDGRSAVSTSDVPDAFLETNRGAWLGDLEENQTLVRIEDLGQPLRDFGYTLDDLAELVRRSRAGDTDALMAVTEFVEAWNGRRDARPAYAAFYDEVRTEAESVDWPHELRDRLGVGHHGTEDGPSVPLALMAYSAKEVFAAARARGVPTAFALPTVLDDGMHPYYFPSPKQQPFGAALHLDLDHALVLTAEVIHYRIDYAPPHIRRLGRITRAHGLHNDELRQARDLHLLALQEETGRGDFGEMFEGR